MQKKSIKKKQTFYQKQLKIGPANLDILEETDEDESDDEVIRVNPESVPTSMGTQSTGLKTI
jgi:hypothetical protein